MSGFAVQLTAAQVTNAADKASASTQVFSASLVGSAVALGSASVPGTVGTLASHPPASHTAAGSFGPVAIGTPLQNTLGYDILVCVVVVVTAATNATFAMGVGSSSTPTTDPAVAAFTSAGVETVTLVAFVPAGYYLSITDGGTITVGSTTTTVFPF